jgi:hypothetical protein
MTELVPLARPLPLATLSDRISYADHLAASMLLPDAYKKQPANVFYAIEYGAMLGLGAMAAITGIHVIKGKPTASAGLIGALVRRAGHRLRVGYDPKTRTGWAEIVRADDPDYTFRAEWSYQRAVKAGLCTLDKDGQPYARDDKNRPTSWEKYPINMTKHRAVTEVARDACEEALFGLHYTPEELGADVDEDGEIIQARAERVQTFADVPHVVVTGLRDQALAATTRDELTALWVQAKKAGLTGTEATTDGDGNDTTIGDLIIALGKAATASTPSPAGGDSEPVEATVTDTPPAAPDIVDAEVVATPAAQPATVPSAGTPPTRGKPDAGRARNATAMDRWRRALDGATFAKGPARLDLASGILDRVVDDLRTLSDADKEDLAKEAEGMAVMDNGEVLLAEQADYGNKLRTSKSAEATA